MSFLLWPHHTPPSNSSQFTFKNARPWDGVLHKWSKLWLMDCMLYTCRSFCDEHLRWDQPSHHRLLHGPEWLWESSWVEVRDWKVLHATLTLNEWLQNLTCVHFTTNIIFIFKPDCVNNNIIMKLVITCIYVHHHNTN